MRRRHKTEFNYTKLTGKLLNLLRRAPSIGRPDKVTATWLSSVGFASSDPDSIIRVLRFVGLVGADDRPTDLWETISLPTRRNRITFAKAVRKSYADLFELYPDAHRKDDQTLKIFFQGRQIGGDVVQTAVIKTFRVLAQFGDFEADAQSPIDSAVDLPEFVDRVAALEIEVKRLLTTYQSAMVRSEALYPLRRHLEELSLENDVLLHESIYAAQAGLFRACHVLAWGGFIDILCERFPTDSVKRQYPKWLIQSAGDLHWVKEDQLIEAGKKLGLYNQATAKTLHGLLNDRNQLAHGSGYFPALNETLGFLIKLFRVIEELEAQ